MELNGFITVDDAVLEFVLNYIPIRNNYFNYAKFSIKLFKVIFIYESLCFLIVWCNPPC